MTARPRVTDGVPLCSEDACPSYDALCRPHACRTRGAHAVGARVGVCDRASPWARLVLWTLPWWPERLAPWCVGLALWRWPRMV